MSETKWTPGPWHTSNSGGFLVCNVTQGVKVYADQIVECEAIEDARLISAAPELYSALEALVQRATDELADPEDVHEVSMARAALAKARGEQP